MQRKPAHDWIWQLSKQDQQKHLKKKNERHELYEKHFTDATTDFLVALLIIGLAILIMSCAHVSGPEPSFKPNIYLPSTTDGRVVFISGDGDKIDSDEPRMLDLYCAPLNDLKLLQEKLLRCEVWK